LTKRINYLYPGIGERINPIRDHRSLVYMVNRHFAHVLLQLINQVIRV